MPFPAGAPRPAARKTCATTTPSFRQMWLPPPAAWPACASTAHRGQRRQRGALPISALQQPRCIVAPPRARSCTALLGWRLGREALGRQHCRALPPALASSPPVRHGRRQPPPACRAPCLPARLPAAAGTAALPARRQRARRRAFPPRSRGPAPPHSPHQWSCRRVQLRRTAALMPLWRRQPTGQRAPPPAAAAHRAAAQATPPPRRPTVDAAVRQAAAQLAAPGVGNTAKRPPARRTCET